MEQGMIIVIGNIILAVILGLLAEIYINIKKKLDEFLNNSNQPSLKPEDEKLVTERLKALGYI